MKSLECVTIITQPNSCPFDEVNFDFKFFKEIYMSRISVNLAVFTYRGY